MLLIKQKNKSLVKFLISVAWSFTLLASIFYKALKEFYRGCNLKILFFYGVSFCAETTSTPVHLWALQEMRQDLQWGKDLSIFAFSPSFTLFLSVSASAAFETVLSFSLLDTPHLHIALGPLVECCIVWGLWRKGIPGHSENTHTHRHANTLTGTRKHTLTHTGKYSCWEPSQPFGRRPSQRRVVLEGLR